MNLLELKLEMFTDSLGPPLLGFRPHIQFTLSWFIHLGDFEGDLWFDMGHLILDSQTPKNVANHCSDDELNISGITETLRLDACSC